MKRRMTKVFVREEKELANSINAREKGGED
jgi:hypothetical protein